MLSSLTFLRNKSTNSDGLARMPSSSAEFPYRGGYRVLSGVDVPGGGSVPAAGKESLSSARFCSRNSIRRYAAALSDVDACVPVAVAVNVAAALSGLGALPAVVQYIEKLVVRIHMLTSIPYGMTSQSSFQSIGFMPRLTRNSLVFEKCLHPKKPL